MHVWLCFRRRCLLSRVLKADNYTVLNGHIDVTGIEVRAVDVAFTASKGAQCTSGSLALSAPERVEIQAEAALCDNEMT
jgi:hypothetical protein